MASCQCTKVVCRDKDGSMAAPAWQHLCDSRRGTSLQSLINCGLCTLGNMHSITPAQHRFAFWNGLHQGSAPAGTHASTRHQRRHAGCQPQLPTQLQHCVSVLRVQGVRGSKDEGCDHTTGTLSAASAQSQHMRPAQRCAASLHHGQPASAIQQSC